MNREDAITLLMMVQLDRAPPPPIEPEKMAALFVSVISDDPPDGQCIAMTENCDEVNAGNRAARLVRLPVCRRETTRGLIV